MKLVATALAIVIALIVFHGPAAAQVTDASVSIVSGDSDCDSQSRISEDGTFRGLIRCINGTVQKFMLAFLPIDADGNLDDTQEWSYDDSDFGQAMQDLGWSVEHGYLVLDPSEFNGTIPTLTFRRFTLPACAAGNCVISGDDPATTAILTAPISLDMVRIVPVTADYSCYSYDTHSSEPCWTYVDCDGVKHYASCVEDAAVQGYSIVHPTCDTCPNIVATEPTTWGRLKGRYRTPGSSRKP